MHIFWGRGQLASHTLAPPFKQSKTYFIFDETALRQISKTDERVVIWVSAQLDSLDVLSRSPWRRSYFPYRKIIVVYSLPKIQVGTEPLRYTPTKFVRIDDVLGDYTLSVFDGSITQGFDPYRRWSKRIPIFIYLE